MIGIIFCNTLSMCPYVDKYIDACKKMNIPYEIILWDRSGKETEYPDNFRVFREQSDVYTSKWNKIGAFLRFRRFLKKELRKNNYEKLVMLTTLPAVLCYSELKRKYRGKYIFDFRDMSFEQYGIYNRLVGRICENAAFTCISSPGFAEILKQENYVVVHNFRYADIKNEMQQMKECSLPIQLLNIGVSRGEKFNRALADAFGNDPRFSVHIVGMGNDTPGFMEYVKQYSNIHVVGTYNNEEKQGYIQRADMLLYYYPCSFNCNAALANKYYDGLIFKKPLIGNINTYSGRRVLQKKVGISLDLNDCTFADQVYEYMQMLESNEFLHAARQELNQVLDEDHIYLEKIDRFLK